MGEVYSRGLNNVAPRRDRNNKSLYADKAIDSAEERWQTAAIHRDRQRDRPFEAGATRPARQIDASAAR